MEAHQRAVILGVDRFIEIKAKPADQLVIETSQSNSPLLWNGTHLNQQGFASLEAALIISRQWIEIQGKQWQGMHLIIESTLDYDGKKIGLGSSGCVIVACMKAIFSFHNISLSKEELFKCAIIAQQRTADIGSGGDIAAAVYGGIIVYQRFDQIWLSQQISRCSLDKLISREWPLLCIRELPLPALSFVAGWTGTPNQTSPYVKAFLDWGKQFPGQYQDMLDQANHIADHLSAAIESNDTKDIQQEIAQYRTWMLNLEQQTGLLIETDLLTQFIATCKVYGFSGKVSGSGGGDCGIAAGGYAEKDQLMSILRTQGIYPIALNIWRNYEQTEPER